MELYDQIVKDAIRNVLFYDGDFIYSIGRRIYSAGKVLEFKSNVQSLRIDNGFLVVLLLKDLYLVKNFEVCFEFGLEDMIMDVKLVYRYNGGTASNSADSEMTDTSPLVSNDIDSISSIVLLFGHNFVQEYSLQKQLLNAKRSKNYLLYSGLLVGSSWDDLQIFAGTIFDGIQIWNTSNDQQYFLKGHQGVVFNLHYRDGYLSSCSDDRTIRIWDLKSLEKPTFTELRGHTARVWKAKIYKDYVVSVGEDATCKVWDRKGWSVNTFSGHGSKNVWSFDFDETNGKILTGGGDGGIQQWDLSLANIKETIVHPQSMFCGPNVGKRSINAYGEEPKSLCFVDNNFQVVLTNKGSLLLYPTTLSGEPPQILFSDAAFGISPILATNGSSVFVSNNSGNLLILDHFNTTFSIHALCDTKICGLFVQGNFVFLFCNESKPIVFLEYRNGSLTLRQMLELPAQFFMLELAYSPERKSICIGSRKGSVAYYQLEEELLDIEVNGCVYDLSIRATAPNLVYRNIHYKDAVTSLLFDPNDPEQLSSVGRDGVFCKFKIHQSTKANDDPNLEVSRNNFTLTKLHSSQISKGWLEKIIQKGDETFICGFYDKKFFIYNETTSQEVCSINCGGGRRNWDIVYKDDVLFGYHQNQKICNFYRPALGNNVVLESYHVFDTKAVLEIELAIERVIVTGSDDGVLQFHSKDLKRLGVCKEKLRSIKCMASKNGFLFTGGSKQELIVWKLQLDSNSQHLNCVRLCQIEPWEDEIEIRVMGLAVEQVGELYYVFSGNSDGSVRLYLFDEMTSKISFLQSDESHARCLLKCQSINVQSRTYFLSGCTGGVLKLWELTGRAIKHVESWKLLQNGFKSMHCREEAGTLSVFVGGDDNSCVLLEYSKGNSRIFKNVNAHSSAVTGCFQAGVYLYTASVDQKLHKHTKDGSLLVTVASADLEIADIADMHVWEMDHELHFVCVGRGLQMFNLRRK